MKRVSVLGRWAVGPLGISLGLLALSAPQPAWAGTWTITRVSDGNCVSGTTTTPWTLAPPDMGPRPEGYPASQPWPPYSPPPIVVMSVGGGTSGSALSTEVSSKGVVRFTCTWTPSSPGEDIPKSMRIPASASASLRWPASGAAPAVSGVAIVGKGPGVSAPAETVENPGDGNYQYRRWVESKSILIPLSGDGGGGTGSRTWTIEVPLEARFQGEATANSAGFGGGASVSADDPIEDNRTLTISRGLPAKRWDDPSLDTNKDEWVAQDGTGYGHTTHSYLAINPLTFILPLKNMPIPGGQTTVHTNSQTIGAAAPGFTNPTYIWTAPELPNVNIFGNLPLGNSTTVALPMGTKAKIIAGAIGDFWAGPATGPKSYDITCVATDTDGTEAEAQYKLTAHDEFENFRSNTDNPQDQIEYQFPSGPGRHINWSHPIPGGQESEAATSTWVSTLTGSLELSGSIGGHITAGAIITAGFEWSAGVAVGLSLGQEFGIEATTHGGKMRYPMLTGHYLRKNYLYDEFSPSGFVRNPSRSDGSWEFWFDDPTSVTTPAPAWSNEFLYGDYNGNGIPDGDE